MNWVMFLFSQRFFRENGMGEKKIVCVLVGRKSVLEIRFTGEEEKTGEKCALKMFRFEDLCGPLIFGESTNGLEEEDDDVAENKTIQQNILICSVSSSN